MIDIYGGMGQGGMTLGEAGGPGAGAGAALTGGTAKGGGTDWSKLLVNASQSMANTPTSSTALSSAGGGGAGGSTAAASLIFPAIAQLLQAITAARGKRGGVGGMMSMGGAR